MSIFERTSHPLGPVSRNFLFCLVTITMFVVSSFFFCLHTTVRPNFIDHNFLPSSKLNAVSDRWGAPLRDESKFEQSIVTLSPPTSQQSRSEVQNTQKCNPDTALLKVYMYDLPPQFHFGLLQWEDKEQKIWPNIRGKLPDYPGALNLQHSIEYWLTLDLLSSRLPDRSSPCTALKVDNSSEADVVFVPFFSSLCYNRFAKAAPHKKSQNKLLQEKLVEYLMEQEEWKRTGGRDHIVLAHHPNSMLDARMSLWPAIFILADFGRYPPNIANVEKDVIAPYKHMIRTFVNDSAGFDSRPTLLYFQGAIYRKDGGVVRQELFYLLKDEKDVHFSFGSVRQNGVSEASHGMHGSKFCLNIAGDTPSSNRLFDAIVSHCVPVIISDDIELPFEDVLDYSEFCIFVRTSDAVKEGFLTKLIRSIGKEEWTRMWEKLKEIEHYFEFQYPSQEDDAVQMIWKAVARKVPMVKLRVHQMRRYARYGMVEEMNPRLLSVKFS
ncbi:probable arabinosyltransferase ARAD1 [Aristolochia californica]|uniref:probable arabinosyltransferase ARAD1 n=1 Tax=Aristolochia californica TaxID=171875 RepID=UPI0035DB2D23